jgi:hypothetical protein
VQYLAGIAGGGVTGGRLSDGQWLFSLNGTIESLPPGSGDPPPDDGDGNDEMPAFGASFSVEELHDVASYIGKEILPLR